MLTKRRPAKNRCLVESPELYCASKAGVTRSLLVSLGGKAALYERTQTAVSVWSYFQEVFENTEGVTSRNKPRAL